ncbi:DUF4173 domain-containing protein [Candidatus Dojkabacteria bacterium]|nr:DUF4173 domain-containing protein [Candidatus Dojkabacteria bacterium]
MKLSTKKFFLLLASAFISLLCVTSFYKTGLGINFAIFNLLLLIILISIAVIFKRLNTSLIINSLLLFLLSIPFCLTTAAPVRVVLFLSWLYFLILTFYTLVQNNSTFEFFRYIAAPLEQVVMAFVSPFFPLVKKKYAKIPFSSTILRIVLGIVIAVPFLIVFVALLVSADLVFKEMVGDIFSTHFILDSTQITVWLVTCFWLTFGAFYYNTFKKEKFIPQEKASKKPNSFLFIESSTVLLLVETLFLVFNIIQITYLFGGENLIKSGDFTYSEYARKGFFELVLASVLALTLIAGLSKVKKVANKTQELIFKAIAVFGILELIPMTISAFYRLYMYESAYGYTRLRAYSHLFIVFLMIVFIWFLIKLLTRIKESIFLYGIELITIFALIFTGFLNIDSFISRLDIEKFEDYLSNETREKDVDLAYLHSLSDDAVPVLVEFFRDSKGELKEETAFYLKARYASMVFEDDRRDFREFNFRRNYAKSLLKENLEEIEEYSQRYENSVVQKYEENTQVEEDLYYYDEGDHCTSGVEFIYIDQEGYENYFSSIEVFKYENSRETVETDSSYNCLSLEKGKYFVAFKSYDLPWEDIEAVFVVDVEEYNDKIILISREGIYRAEYVD